MSYLTEQILVNLREARKRKGLSQRELSSRAGVPQSHISKIESGNVDLRISSLIALARVLDLEVVIAPRKTIPAINSIIRSTDKPANDNKALAPAYQLEGGDDEQ